MYLPVTSSRGEANDVSAWTIGELCRCAESLGATTPRAASQMTDDAATRLAVGDLLREYLREPWRWVTFVSLLPSQQIVAHRDPPLPAGLIRYHLPILTNPGCWSFSGGSWQQLAVGTIYTMAPEVDHGAVNWGSVVRVHLLVDAEEGAVR
jgi:hypothetical protein